MHPRPNSSFVQCTRFSHGILKRGVQSLPEVQSAAKTQLTAAASLSELLNALDGVGAQAGRIVIMTTNDISSLDDALIRPGRCDRVIKLSNANETMATRLFSSFFHEQSIDQHVVARLAPEFGGLAGGGRFSMAALQGQLIRHRGDPKAAVSSFRSNTSGSSRGEGP